MVDSAILASRIASIRDAIARIREVLPAEPAALDTRRLHEIASTRLEDLVEFCEALARRASG